MFAILKSNIGRRIILLVMVVMLPLLAALGVTGWLAVEQNLLRVSHENRALAQAIGSHVDYLLSENLERLENIRFAPGIDIQNDDQEPEMKALHSAYIGSLFNSVFIADLEGKVLWSEPYRQDIGASIGDYPPVLQALSSKRPVISDILTTNPDSEQAILIVTPLRNSEGQIVGLVGGRVEPAGNALREMILPVQLSKTGYVDIIDSGNMVLASSNPQRVLQDRGTDSREKVLSEMVGLRNASWSITVNQFRSEALASVNMLGLRMVVVGLLSLVVVFFLSWGMARSLVKPIDQLKTAAQNISRGNLLQPVPPLGDGEIGELGKSFDSMRLELKKSLEKIQEWNRQLENRIKERTRQLQESYHEIERKEAARSQLLQKVLMVQEEERKRVARELHDETTQSILGVIMRLEAAAALPAEEAGKMKQILADSRNLAVSTLDNVHKIIFDLRPSVLDDLGLLSAVRWYAQNRLEKLGVNARVEVTGEEKKLPPQVEIALFRVVQEAITNIRKYAQANNVLLNIEFNRSTVSIEIEDDGHGFDMKTLSALPDENRGMGITGMRERINLLGGKFHIESQPGSGTRISVEVPVHQ